jgi:ribose 5-phosphate isomerase A
MIVGRTATEVQIPAGVARGIDRPLSSRMANDDAKRAAARAALAELPEHGIIGIGTGSTTRFFIDVLGEAVAAGKRYTAVPTSEASRRQAQALGIPLLGDDGPWDIAVTVDGADEVDPALDLIKGGGGAQTREKIVNFSSRRNVIVVDASKQSPRLGTHWPVPIEVLGFAHAATRAHLAVHGAPRLRERDGAPVKTDAGNLIYDLTCGPIADAPALDRALRGIPGVVETGLFIARADVVLVAGDAGVQRLTRAH